jgi:hypothetical protein
LVDQQAAEQSRSQLDVGQRRAEGAATDRHFVRRHLKCRRLPSRRLLGGRRLDRLALGLRCYFFRLVVADLIGCCRRRESRDFAVVHFDCRF